MVRRSHHWADNVTHRWEGSNYSVKECQPLATSLEQELVVALSNNIDFAKHPWTVETSFFYDSLGAACGNDIGTRDSASDPVEQIIS